jgi:hypothetical protein
MNLCVSLSKFLIFSLALSTVYSSNLYARIKPTKTVEWVEYQTDSSGFFSNLMRVIEWVYTVKMNKRLGLYINMKGFYQEPSNFFERIFECIEDDSISLSPPKEPVFLKTSSFPSCLQLNHYPTTGMKNFDGYVMMNPLLYRDPDFALYRQRLNRMLNTYIRPNAKIQKKIEAQLHEIKRNPSVKKTIGIHLRFAKFYQDLNSESDFLDLIEKDIDQIMNLHDIQTTQIYLATLLKPLLERLEKKYLVISQEMPRFDDFIEQDWSLKPYSDPLDLVTEVIVDAWALSRCDAVYCGASNMILFVGCLNPTLPITLLKTIENSRSG